MLQFLGKTTLNYAALFGIQTGTVRASRIQWFLE